MEELKRQLDAKFKDWQQRNPDKSIKSNQNTSISRRSPPVPIRTSSNLKNATVLPLVNVQTSHSNALNDISASNLFNILDKSDTHVLILDLRPIKDHINGHLKWKRMNPSSKATVPSGVVPLEPEFLNIPQ